MPADLSFKQGETVEMYLTIKDSDGVVIDITNDTFEGKIKDLADLAITLATFVCTIHDGPGGQVKLVLSSTDSLAIPSNVEYNTKGVRSATPLAVLMYDVYRTETITLKKRAVADGLVTVFPAISLEAV